MSFKLLSRLAGVLALTIGLAGCIDVEMDIEIKSDTTAKGVMTMAITAEAQAAVDAMLKGLAEQMGADPKDMMAGQSLSLKDNCEDGVGSETPDGGSKCVVEKEGTFAELAELGDGGGPKFETLADGKVKVTLPVEDINASGNEAGMGEMVADPSMEALFTNHFITFRVRGLEIVESNMEISADKKSAEFKIPTIEMMRGKVELEEDLYAIVRTR